MCPRPTRCFTGMKKTRSAFGVDKRDEMKGATVKMARGGQRGKIKAIQEGPLKDLVVALERT